MLPDEHKDLYGKREPSQDDIRAEFAKNAEEFDALMVRMLDENNQLISAMKAMVKAQHAGPITDEMFTAWTNARALLTILEWPGEPSQDDKQESRKIMKSAFPPLDSREFAQSIIELYGESYACEVIGALEDLL